MPKAFDRTSRANPFQNCKSYIVSLISSFASKREVSVVLDR